MSSDNDNLISELATPGGAAIDLMDLVRQRKEREAVLTDQPLEKEVAIDKPAELTVEEKARQQGWTPKEQFRGNPDEWVDAKEFVARGSFFRKIEAQNKQIEQLKTVIDSMAETLSKSEERGYQRAQEELNLQKAQARLTGDVDAFEKVLKEEQELQQQFKNKTEANAPPAVVPSLPPDLEAIRSSDAWKKFELQNPWVKGTDDLSDEIRGYAQNIGTKFEQKHPNTTPDEALEFVHKQVRVRFPELDQSNRDRPAIVSSSSVVSKADHGTNLSNLTPGQKETIEYLKRTKSPFLKSYMENLSKEVPNIIEIDTSKFHSNHKR
jgi:small-conductance mechanosensitive channel